MECRDVPAYYLEKILKGRAKEPTLGKARAIAGALGVSLEEMARMTYGESRGGWHGRRQR